MKWDGGREQESEVQGRGQQVTEGNLRQSTSEDIGDVFVSNVYFCLSFPPSHHSLTFHQSYRIWGESQFS